MRIFDIICLGSISFLTFIAVIADCEKHKEDDDPVGGSGVISEVVQFPGDQFTGESASGTNEVTDDFLPIIGLRIKRNNAGALAMAMAVEAVNVEATKRREGINKRKNKRERESEIQRRRSQKEREKSTEKYRQRKKGRKKEPLTRHARRPQRSRNRRPHKEAGANRTRSSPRQRPSHERRNLEKQYLVRNRTLELFERRTTEAAVANRSALISHHHPVSSPKDPVLIERRITPEKIGQILGEGRRTSSLRIADLLIPKTILEAAGSKENGVKIQRSRSKPCDRNVERGEKSCKTTADVGTPLFIGKLKSMAMNVSRINEAVQDPRGNNADFETSGSKEESGDGSYRYDYENVFEDPSVSSWVNPPQSEEADAGREDEEYFLDTALLSPVYMPIDDRITLHQGLATLLSRLFQTLRNSTDYENQELLQDLDFDNSVQGDLCQKWLDCKDKLEEAFLGTLVLPACPCHYPSSIFYDDKIWDEGQQKHFRWRDVSGEAERLDVYKPGATYCIRSLLAQGGGSAAAQHCCYDGRRRLLTRGSGAGTPNFVSPEVSSILHERIDLLPWRLCKGDFSRFNKVRPPNNDNHCKGNPDEDEYQRQIVTTKHY